MNWADFTILAILVFSGLISLKRGFVKEALSLVVWVVALIVAGTFREPLAQMLTDVIETPSLRMMAAFAILFIVTLVVGGLINHLVAHLVNVTGLGGTDRFLGFLFGVFRGGLVIVALVIIVPEFIPIEDDGWWRESVLIPHFVALKSVTLELFEAVKNLFGMGFKSSTLESTVP
ncbi:CvpA family protein [Halioxenophilus aromaticivorans]|uniref:CvpA family protein n=1 Tax=Halioxenophilus aromaticivorans TaxID=1306992 RepID=A0AAV3U8D2_9ALTE